MVVGNLGAVAEHGGDLVRARTALAESLAVGGAPPDQHSVSARTSLGTKI
jgi:hypothetical protein